MLITRRSMTSNIERTMDLPITAEQISAHNKGAMIQDAMPNLTPGQREFYLTGITDDEWNDMFGEDGDKPAPKEHA